MGRDLLRDRDGSRGGQRAVIHTGAGDDVAGQPGIGSGKPGLLQRRINGGQVRFMDMGQHDVLVVADAQVVMAVLLGQIGQQAHLVRAGVARRFPMRLEGHDDAGIAVHLVRMQVGVGPAAKGAVPGPFRRISVDGRVAEGRGREAVLEDRQRLAVGAVEIAAAVQELLLDLGLEDIEAALVDGDLDARLVFVVAASRQVVGGDDRLDIGQQVFLGQEVADHLAQHRRAAQTAAHPDLEARSAVLLDQAQADVMGGDQRTVAGRAGDGDLELARQELEFRMIRGPAAQQFGIGPRIHVFVGSRARKGVCRDVADGVARGLDGVHPDGCQVVQHVGNVHQPGPVELDVLPRGPVAVALVIGLGQVRQHPHLVGADRAIGNGHPQHVGVQLQVNAVHQAQGPELVLGQAAVQAAFDLSAELGRAVAHIVGFHGTNVKHCWPRAAWLASGSGCRESNWTARAGGTLRGNGSARVH